MRYGILILLIIISSIETPFMASPLMASLPDSQTTSQEKGALIRDIDIEGFVLGDKDQFIKLFKPYRNKYLTKIDMDTILLQLQIIYEKEGYQELVSIGYQVIKKHRLVFTVLMIS